jgi:hypothetical protein
MPPVAARQGGPGSVHTALVLSTLVLVQVTFQPKRRFKQRVIIR